MNRSDVLTLAIDYAIAPVDAATLDRYLTDVLEECARYDEPPHIDVELASVTAGTDTYTPPVACLRILAAFYAAKHLSAATVADLEAYSRTWRTDSGSPWALSFDEQTGGDYLLYPTPDASSGALIPANGDPLGLDYPTGWCALIFGSGRSVDLHDYTAFPIALRVLAREFSRPSSHRDKAFADGCLALADLLFQLIGVAQ